MCNMRRGLYCKLCLTAREDLHQSKALQTQTMVMAECSAAPTAGPTSRSHQQVPTAGESQAELPSSLCPAPSTPTSPLCRTTCQTGRAAPKEMGHRLSCVSSCLISIAGESERGWSKTPPSTVKGQEVTEGAAAREILTAHPEKILCYQQGQP